MFRNITFCHMKILHYDYMTLLIHFDTKYTLNRYNNALHPFLLIIRHGVLH